MVLNIKNGFSLKASFYGSVVSTLILLLIPTIAFLLAHESFENDGPIKGLVTLFMVSPVLLGLKFVYFCILNFLKCNKLLLAFFISSVVALCIVIAIYWPLSNGYQFLYPFLVLGCSLNLGTIVWYKKHLTSRLRRDC